jgi:ankyrin repeat protein
LAGQEGREDIGDLFVGSALDLLRGCDVDGNTALHKAILGGNLDCVLELLRCEKGLALAQGDVIGGSCLDADEGEAEDDEDDGHEWLVRRPNFLDVYPVHVAISLDDVACARVLLERSGYVDPEKDLEVRPTVF